MPGKIRIMDSSVYLAILKVPKHASAECSEELANKLVSFIDEGDTIIITLGTIIECGNHIARALDGRRHDIMEKFAQDILAAIEQRAPYSIGQLGNENQLRIWLNSFKEQAYSNLEFGDVICIEEFKIWQELGRPVEIWSIDEELQGYKYQP